MSSLIQACDIAIIPINKINELKPGIRKSLLAEHSLALNQGKSPNKLIMALGNGLPTLCSRIPSHEVLAKEADSDLCCVSTSEWVEKTSRLKQSLERRKEFSQKGLSFIEEKYSHQNFINQWDNVFESLK